MLLGDSPFVARLDAAIHHSPYLKGQRLHVATDTGRVVLEGIVRSYYQKQMAQEAIRRIDGVRWIENRLEVLTS
jgi:osmotically-inducible protein OsmY